MGHNPPMDLYKLHKKEEKDNQKKKKKDQESNRKCNSDPKSARFVKSLNKNGSHKEQ